MKKSNIEKILEITENVELENFTHEVKNSLTTTSTKVTVGMGPEVIFFNILSDRIKFFLSIELVEMPEGTIPVYFESTTNIGGMLSVSVFSNKVFLDSNNSYSEDINYLMLGILSESGYKLFPKEGNEIIDQIHTIMTNIQKLK